VSSENFIPDLRFDMYQLAVSTSAPSYFVKNEYFWTRENVILLHLFTLENECKVEHASEAAINGTAACYCQCTG